MMEEVKCDNKAKKKTFRNIWKRKRITNWQTGIRRS